jgi:hypothetical protein
MGFRYFNGIGVLMLALIGQSLAASADVPGDDQVWQAWGGTMELEIRGDYLPDFGIEVLYQGQPVTTRERIQFQLHSVEPFRLLVPFGNLEAVDPSVGLVTMQTGLVLRFGDNELDLDELTLVSGQWGDHPAFVARDAQGRTMFTLTHMHILAEHERGLLTVQNAEVEASPQLAALLGVDALANMPIGLGWLDLHMEVPPGADTSGQGPGCSERPIWPQDGEFEAEVALIAMSNIAYQGIEPGTGLVKAAPSATLKNISLADIPWFQQFSNPAIYPYEPADQHPFLVWSIYRIKDGRIEMLAESGVKHAFLTINQNCDINCGNSNILWPGCEDTYSAGNNDTSTYQGPKDEIEASLGLWDNCGSFFDPGCTGSQTGFSGQWLNRLLIDPDEFEHEGAEYFMDAWYVIQYDTNIWSTMGYRPIDPAPNGSGWVFNPGPFEQGPAISEWVSEDRHEPMAGHRMVVVPSATPEAPYPGNMPQGHLRLLVRVHDQEDGTFRYNYALQNYDFERGITEFHIPLAAGLSVTDTWIGAVGEVDDWDIEIDDSGVTFRAPEGQYQPWFTLYNFEIEVDAAPVPGELILGLGSDAVVEEMPVSMLAPPTGEAALALDRSSVDFGEVEVGTISGEEPVVLTSSGSATVQGISVAGFELPFVEGGDCPEGEFDLDPGEFCTLVFQFSPTEAGEAEQVVQVASDAPGSPLQIHLQGQGFEIPSLEVEPVALDFGPVVINQSASAVVLLHNSGAVDVTVTALEPLALPFVLDLDDCGDVPFTLAPESTCELFIGFAPEALESYAEILVIESDADESPHEVSLSGEGVPVEIFDDRFETLGQSGAALPLWVTLGRN